MATRLVPNYIEVTDYTQIEEDILASSLIGISAPKNHIVIFNTTLNKTRIWNGSSFGGAPIKNPDGGDYTKNWLDVN